MKVVKPVDKNDKEFHQVTTSQVFELDGKVFMKLDQFNTHMKNYNAINLTTGQFINIVYDLTVRVHPKTELHLK